MPNALAWPEDARVKLGAVRTAKVHEPVAKNLAKAREKLGWSHKTAFRDLVKEMVAADRERFLKDTLSDLIVLDIPLLFETGADARVDAVVVVSAQDDLLARKGCDRLEIGSRLLQGHGQVEPGRGEARLDLDGAAQGGDRLLRLALLAEQDAQENTQ